jgi:hypothetical protein
MREKTQQSRDSKVLGTPSLRILQRDEPTTDDTNLKLLPRVFGRDDLELKVKTIERAGEGVS